MCCVSTETYSKSSRGTKEARQTEKKTGWEFGVLPCLTYSSDMGFQYGVFGDFYYYGDGSTYPNYRDKISYEASHFTKGLTRLYLAYDSKVLIPKVRTTLSFTYIDDPLYNFWGSTVLLLPFIRH